MFDILKNKEFWIGCYCGVMVICIVVRALFFPSGFEEKGRKLCQLKQYEYCTKEELLKIIK
jgi:hypothetical protein